jgi:hypothetical protein
MQFLKHFPPLFWVIFQVDFMDDVRLESLMKKKEKRKEYASMRIHPLVKIFSSGEDVGDSVCASRDVFEDEVEVL